MNELWNLDFVLAKFIHEKLVDFKKLYQEEDSCGIIYSHELESGQKTEQDLKISNDTIWFLDEMIWTFDNLRNTRSHPTFEKIYNDVNDKKAKVNGILNGIKEHPLYEQYKQELEEEEKRISKNLQLFSKYFRHLWV